MTTYHVEVMRRHEKEWPTLWRAIDKLLEALKFNAQDQWLAERDRCREVAEILRQYAQLDECINEEGEGCTPENPCLFCWATDALKRVDANIS